MKTVRKRCAELAGVLLSLALVPSAGAELVTLDRIAAVVDNEVVMESDLQRRLDDVGKQIEARGTTAPPPEVMRRQVLDRLVIESIQSQLAQRSGLRIDDETLNGAITGIAKQNGMELRAFLEQLSLEGIDYASFREDVRRDMLASRLRQRRVGERVRVTDADVESYLRSADGRTQNPGSYRLAHILVGVPESADVASVQAAKQEAEELVARAREGADFADLAVRHSDAGNALEGGDLGLRTAAQLPVLYAATLTGLKPGDIAGPLRSGSGFHILKLVEYQADQERVVEQARTRHVLIKPSAIRTSAEARELANRLRERIAAGEDFVAIARKHSEDSGSALAGGDLDWVSPGQMVEEFEKAMNATGTGELSAVFETQYGFHFLQVQERRRQDTSDEYRRIQARNAIWKRKFDAELETWLRELRNEAYVEIRGNPG